MSSSVHTGRRRTAWGATPCLLLLAFAGPALANGRMPGATDLSVSRADPSHLVVRATFGLVQTRDGGRSWHWRCEQALGVSGESDPPIALLPGGGLLLLAPAGGAVLSRDDGCSFTPVDGAPSGRRNVDLTVDPSDPAHVLVVTSTVADVDPQGVVTYENLLLETRNAATTWTEASQLPGDFVVETVEIAASDPNRIYVSGTASSDPLEGIVERSDDAGRTWTRSTVGLPQGSGSLFVSAVHPTDPDRVWVRVPARGDVFGFFPTSLLASTDGAATFAVVAGTERAMFGFALSPDGEQLAYGGPSDGLFVGPSDGSAFTKVSGLGVRCLEWEANGLHACASEPRDPFTIGVSAGADGAFTPLYRTKDTCPTRCGADSGASAICQKPWAGVALAIGANPACTSADGGSSHDSGTPTVPQDAALDGPQEARRDAGPSGDGPSVAPGSRRPRASGGCSVRGSAAAPPACLLALAVAVHSIRRRRCAQGAPQPGAPGSSKHR